MPLDKANDLTVMSFLLGDRLRLVYFYGKNVLSCLQILYSLLCVVVIILILKVHQLFNNNMLLWCCDTIFKDTEMDTAHRDSLVHYSCHVEESPRSLSLSPLHRHSTTTIFSSHMGL